MLYHSIQNYFFPCDDNSYALLSETFKYTFPNHNILKHADFIFQRTRDNQRKMKENCQILSQKEKWCVLKQQVKQQLKTCYCSVQAFFNPKGILKSYE